MSWYDVGPGMLCVIVLIPVLAVPLSLSLTLLLVFSGMVSFVLFWNC